MLGDSDLIKVVLSKVLQIQKTQESIMSVITDWAAKQQADLTAISGVLDSIATGVNALDALIKQLQNTSGSITPEDQALLDQIEAQSAALVTKAQQINTQPPA